jgi:pimeloyl-ACP methyl ester carboxylesterase
MDVSSFAEPAGVASEHMRGIQQRLDEDRALVETRKLQAQCACFFRPSHAQTPCGVVLMLHGFTAGPWQYAYIAEHLSKQGLHCYAARLPGHGACTTDGIADSSLLPQSNQGELYAACALQALEDAEALARNLQLPLYVVGFSAGAALATDLLHTFPEKITRAVLIAPLLKFYGRWTHLLFGSLVHLPFSGRLTNRMRLAWTDAAPAPGAWSRPGHGAFFLGNVQGLAAYTAKLRRNTKPINVPCQFILTAADQKVDLAAALALAQRADKPHEVFCFPLSANIAHSMLTPHENPNEQARLKVYEIVTSFLLKGQTHRQPPA